MATLLDLEKQKFNSSGEIKVSGDFAVAGQTDYSTSDITALGSSTNINDWVSAFHDGQLTYKYVQEYNGTQEKVAYFTHPSLGNGNKCLRLFKLYSTQNSVLVLQGVKASIVDWTFDANIQGTVSITLGTITSPAANAAAGTDVCSVTITNTGSGSNTLSLSGANASLYQLNNTTQGQTGSTLSNVLTTDTVVIETASNFTNVTYSHSLTVTITESHFNLSAYQNISTSGTEVSDSNNEFALSSQATTSSSATDFQINGTEKSLWPSLGNATNTFPTYSDTWSLSFWAYIPTATRTNNARTCLIKQQVGTAQGGIQVFLRGNPEIEMYITSTTANTYKSKGSDGLTFDAWNHIIFTYNGSGSINIYINNGTAGNRSGTGTYPTALNNATVNNLMLHTFAHTPAAGAAKARANDVSILDELIAFNIELDSSQRTELYNSGDWINPSDLSFASNVESYFRMGDGSNDNVANNQVYDEEDSSRYFEKVGTGTHSITQLTMDDPVYYSTSGNHKYISDTWRGFITGTILVGNYYRDSSTDKKGFFPDLDSTTGFRSSNNVSYSFWAKFNNISNLAALWQEHYVLSATYQSYTSTYINGSNFFVFAAHNSSRRDRYCTVPTDNNWHHVVVTTTTADIVSGAIFYIDGAAVSTNLNSYGGGDLSSTRTQPVDAINFGGTLYTRGSSSGTYSNSGSGTLVMDEFSTWKKTLTASEVTELYNNGSPNDLTQHSAASDLQRWFRFGDTTGDGIGIKDSQDTSVELVSYDSQNNIQNH